jgi:hypothetical protein
MGSDATHSREQTPDSGLSQKMDAFARALSDLSHQYGIGIEGAVLYQMEPEDDAFGYIVDEDSTLIRA